MYQMKQENSGSLADEYLDPTTNSSKQQEKDSCTKSKSGHWNDGEHLLYLEFLNKARGIENHSRKGQPLFKRMSQLIGTRSPSQCRSHHQKFNPFNPLLKKNKKKTHKFQHKFHDKYSRLKSKQIMRQYFASHKESTDEE